MKKVAKCLLLICVVAGLLLSYLIFASAWRGTSKTPTVKTPRHSESLRTATPETLVSPVASSTPQPPDDYQNGTKQMWMMFPSELCRAIQAVETGGHPDPENAVGDGGRSIGPLQISRACWQDAKEHDPAIGGTYEDCRKLEYAKRIFWAYLDRWAPTDDYQTCARIWNGGPKGASKGSTDAYWRRVNTALELGKDNALHLDR